MHRSYVRTEKNLDKNNKQPSIHQIVNPFSNYYSHRQHTQTFLNFKSLLTLLKKKHTHTHTALKINPLTNYTSLFSLINSRTHFSHLQPTTLKGTCIYTGESAGGREIGSICLLLRLVKLKVRCKGVAVRRPECTAGAASPHLLAATSA